MADWFRELSPIYQALLGGLFTWIVTAAGASMVFFVRTVSRRFLDAMLGFAAGVMIAASVWSLLLPAIDLSADSSLPEWVPPSLGFLIGAAFLWLMDQLLPHLHFSNFERRQPEGLKTAWQRSSLLIAAITLHNIPEGLAVGVAFGAVADSSVGSGTTLAAAVTLAIGIGLQNFPEGIAVALPLRGEGMGRFKSFWYGQMSAVVEPIAAVIGAAAVLVVSPVLPYALAFAAGAMIYVVVEELIPRSHEIDGNRDIATIGTVIGFMVMMILDVALS